MFPATFPVTFQIVDARGLGLTDATIRINRSGKTETHSLNSSSAVTSLPPGDYSVSVVSHNDVISKRPVTISSERTVELITAQEPLFPLLVIITIAVVGAILVVYGIIKKDLAMTFVSLAACFAVIATMLPWWSLEGSTSEVTTASTLYLAPPAFVTITRTASVLTGELPYLPDLFTTILLVILVMIVLGCLLCGTSFLFQRMKKQKMRLLSILGAILVVGCGLVIFLFAMTLYSQVSVGSILGAGTIGVTIPGVNEQALVPCHWGPAVGFFMYILVVILLFATLILVIRKNKRSKEV